MRDESLKLAFGIIKIELDAISLIITRDVNYGPSWLSYPCSVAGAEPLLGY
jgi:hypothetical protein